MRARDLMTTDVVTVRPDTSVRHLAQLLLRRRISAVPVVDDSGKLIGIVSEGDLMGRAEHGARPRKSWWLELVTTPEEKASQYVRGHALHVGDIMTEDVITVEEDEAVQRIAALLEEKKIKRVPVCRMGRVVGIVSRADILHGVANARLDQTAPGDEAIRLAVMTRMHHDAGVRDALMNVTVENGVVHLWGRARSESERRAARVCAETVRGVHGVQDHLTLLPEFMEG